jgi:hypothetical protein
MLHIGSASPRLHRARVTVTEDYVWFTVFLPAFVSLALSACWVGICNKRQDWLISGACSELAKGSNGRLTAEYHTFLAYPNRVFGSQPPRVIVIAPSQQYQAVYGAHAQPVQAVVVAQPAQAVFVAQPAQVAYGVHEEP